MSRNASILVVDDEIDFQEMLVEALSTRGHSVDAAPSAEAGIKRMTPERYDLVLLDVRLPGMSGIEAISHFRDAAPDTDIIVMTAHAAKDAGVEAIRKGAYDFFSKPFSLAEMEVVIRRVLEKRQLQTQVEDLRQSLGRRGPVERIVGNSSPVRELVHFIERVAPLDVNVLVTGETGTGKELISEVIHAMSARAEGPLISLNCAAIPENLLESELFGHEKGAFTGANAVKKGKFELAQGGTILLDEIGDMPLHLQPKLLRAVEQRRIERLGGTVSIDLDVRIIAATNVRLAEQVRRKTFREDLFYRLNVAQITLPPLRERKDDIALLAGHFLDRVNTKLGTALTGFTPRALRLFYEYDWPGNVRQLSNAVERCVIFAAGAQVTEEDAKMVLHGVGHLVDEQVAHSEEQVVPSDETSGPQIMDFETVATRSIKSGVAQLGGRNLKQALTDYERELIESALESCGFKQTEAARVLGISAKNLWNKLQKHGIEIPARS